MKKERMMGKIIRIIKSPLLPFATLTIIVFICHLFLAAGNNDDEYYRVILSQRGLLQQLEYSYYHWAGRTFIEIGMLLFNGWPVIIWRIMNTAAVVACAYAAARILEIQRNAVYCWLLCLLFLIFPWGMLGSAGWITTTVAYLWPAAAALIAIIPVVDLIKEKEPSRALMISGVPLALFASNMEQCGMIIITLMTAAAVWQLAQKRNVRLLQIAQLAAALAGFLWNITAPGSRARYETERTSWFLDFEMKSTISKMELGISKTLAELFFRPNIIFFLLCAFITCIIFLRYKILLYRLCAAIPSVIALVFGLLQNWTIRLFPSISNFIQPVLTDGIITLDNNRYLSAYLPLLLLCATMGMCIIDLYIALGHRTETAAVVLVFSIGLASRAVLGFSPTIHASGLRPSFFLMQVILILTVYIFKQIVEKSGMTFTKNKIGEGDFNEDSGIH